jgi:hypothetical protein
VAGYLNRFIDLAFPDLAGVDDAGRAIVWVKIRNPRLLSGGTSCPGPAGSGSTRTPANPSRRTWPRRKPSPATAS